MRVWKKNGKQVFKRIGIAFGILVVALKSTLFCMKKSHSILCLWKLRPSQFRMRSTKKIQWEKSINCNIALHFSFALPRWKHRKIMHFLFLKHTPLPPQAPPPPSGSHQLTKWRIDKAIRRGRLAPRKLILKKKAKSFNNNKQDLL